MNARAVEVVFRVDARVASGLGHAKRCLSLAQALRDGGARCRFLTREVDVASLALFRAQGFEAQALPAAAEAVCTPSGALSAPPGGQGAALAHARWLDLTQQQDAMACLNHLGDSPPDWVVVDHYALDARWHAWVAKALGCRLAAIDDLADRELAVDVLIDHNHAADHRAKYGALLPAQALLLGGPRHALLAPAYASAPVHAVADRVRSIGIFMGGTDEGNLSRTALDACRDAGFDGLVEIVTTSACPHRGALQEIAACRPATTVLVDLPELSGFFSRHGLQIGAGGGATWERCCVGAPTLALAVAANQHPVLEPLAGLGVLLTNPPGVAHAAWLVSAIGQTLDDAALRRRLSQTSRQLVDGEGARRVAQALLAHPAPRRACR